MTKRLLKADPRELVVFVGHAADAKKEAAVIKRLQGRMQDILTKANEIVQGPLNAVRVWEWDHDALGRSGGQDELITPYLRRAQFAVFIFKTRVGQVTKKELDQCREPVAGRPHLAVVFEDKERVKESIDIDDDDDLATLNERRAYRKALQDGWAAPDSQAVRPLDDFRDHAHLEEIVLAQFDRVINDIIARGLESSSPGGLESEAPSPFDLAHYRLYVGRMHSRLAPFFSGKLSLDEVFVDLELKQVMDGLGDHRLDKEAFNLEALMQLPPPDGAEGAGRWVVLGEPGAGKSTLARHLAFKLAERDNKDGGPIPLYVSLSQFAAEAQESTVFAMTEEQLRRCGDSGVVGAAEALEAAAEAGRLWIFLDGYDEVPGEHRRRIDASIVKLEEAYPQTPICILSRPIGYEDISPKFHRAHVRRLDESRQRGLLERWLGVETASELWERLATRPLLCEATSTPLMLALVAKLWTKTDGLPSNRLELYEQAVLLLLTRGFSVDGNQAKAVAAPLDAGAILESLSLSLQADGVEVWSKADINDRLLGLASEDNKLRLRLDGWPHREAFLDDVAENSGLLGALDGPLAPWRYLHKQFREFLAARALKKRGEAEIIKRAESLDGDSVGHWGECIGMACGLLPKPLEALEPLRESNPELAKRMLLDVDGVEPEEALDFLFGLPEWDGDDLVKLVRGWGIEAALGREQASQALWKRVGPGDILTQAYLHYALEVLGPVDRDRFFGACGRPLSDVGIEWKPIPADSFVMGSASGDSDEQPLHGIALSAFELAVYPVTNEHYEAFDPDHRRRDFEGVSPGDLANHPVVDVSWWEARLFCAWVGGALPTEAQWEYACRAGTTTDYWSGDGRESLARVGWFSGNAESRTHEVGELEANPWGLHDTHGNVWEWCREWFHGDAYETPVQGGDGLRGLQRAVYRVLRGGSWFFDADYCRSAYRFGNLPSSRWWLIGFRPARVSPLTP